MYIYKNMNMVALYVELSRPSGVGRSVIALY